MIQVEILIPLFDNNKAAFTPAWHAQFEQKLNELFGGHQRQPGTYSGQWIDGGQVYADELHKYVVAVEGLLKNAEGIAELVAFAKVHYSQLAVYVTYLGISEIL